MGTPCLNLNESLFESDRAEDWVHAEPRVYTRRQMEALISQLTALGFQRLRWQGAPARVINLVGRNPWDPLPSAPPPKEGLDYQGCLALDVRDGGSTGRWTVAPGFLKWNDRWYFSPNGENYEHTVSSTTLWKLRVRA